MGHDCWICGRTRPNERFSGRGRRRHECRECQGSAGPEDRARIQAHLDLHGFLSQENISARNLAFAERWMRDGDAELRALAEIVFEVGRVHPRRRKRRAFLLRNRPDLWARMAAAGVANEPESPGFAEPDALIWASGVDSSLAMEDLEDDD